MERILLVGFVAAGIVTALLDVGMVWRFHDLMLMPMLNFLMVFDGASWYRASLILLSLSTQLVS